MEFEKWEPIYNQIITDFGYSRQEDERAAKILFELIENKDIVSFEILNEIIKSKDAFIFGAGPSLEKETQIDNFRTEFNGTLITADGATSALIEKDIIPDIVVTDLDGKIEDQVRANDEGAVVIIHAHGDNINKINKWVPKFRNKVLGTTQAEPFGTIQNFGGFTDGDRAVFLAAHFKARKIHLVAFNFEEPGDYSYQYDLKTKIKKLTWANGLIGLIVNPQVVFYPY
jgi:uncharacterized Rossmann fold enzyme